MKRFCNHKYLGVFTRLLFSFWPAKHCLILNPLCKAIYFSWVCANIFYSALLMLNDEQKKCNLNSIFRCRCNLCKSTYVHDKKTNTSQDDIVFFFFFVNLKYIYYGKFLINFQVILKKLIWMKVTNLRFISHSTFTWIIFHLY